MSELSRRLTDVSFQASVPQRLAVPVVLLVRAGHYLFYHRTDIVLANEEA